MPQKLHKRARETRGVAEALELMEKLIHRNREGRFCWGQREVGLTEIELTEES